MAFPSRPVSWPQQRGLLYPLSSRRAVGYAPLSGRSGGSPQYGTELDGGEGPPHYQFVGAAVQPAEDARADAGDEEDPGLLQVGVAVQARASISSGTMRTLSVSVSREMAGKS